MREVAVTVNEEEEAAKPCDSVTVHEAVNLAVHEAVNLAVNEAVNEAVNVNVAVTVNVAGEGG